MTPLAAEIIHVAGKYQGFVQSCSRCGFKLIDYRKAAWPAGQGDPRGWAEGALVGVGFSERASWTVGDGEATCSATPERAMVATSCPPCTDGKHADCMNDDVVRCECMDPSHDEARKLENECAN